MQKEKRNVLIVVIAAIVIIGIAIGLFFLISFVKDRNYKKEHWFESDAPITTIITIKHDRTEEGEQEIKLKDYANYGRDDRIVIEFHKIGDWSISYQDIDVGIVNDGVVIRESSAAPWVNDKDLIRTQSYGPKRFNFSEVYDVIAYKLYKQADDDSLDYVKTIEVVFYGYVWGNP